MPKKSSPPRAESESTNWRKLESTNWRKLYRAAILELNPSKLLQHIAKAEKALVQRARELFQSAGDNVEEAEALDDAMYALHAFRSTLKCNSSIAPAIAEPNEMKVMELTRPDDSTGKGSNQQLLQSFKDFFDLQVQTPQQPCQCERCGSTMEYFDAHFWFYDTKLSWNIPLRFCPSCDPQTVPKPIADVA